MGKITKGEVVSRASPQNLILEMLRLKRKDFPFLFLEMFPITGSFGTSFFLISHKLSHCSFPFSFPWWN
jgi:hypothetical protein